MRALTFSDTAIDLSAQTLPFQPNNTVVLFNTDSGSITVEECDTSDGVYTTLATIAGLTAVEVTLNKEFIKVSTAKNCVALAN